MNATSIFKRLVNLSWSWFITSLGWHVEMLISPLRGGLIIRFNVSTWCNAVINGNVGGSPMNYVVACN